MNNSTCKLILLLKHINKRKQFVFNRINVIKLHEDNNNNTCVVINLLSELSKCYNDDIDCHLILLSKLSIRADILNLFYDHNVRDARNDKIYARIVHNNNNARILIVKVISKFVLISLSKQTTNSYEASILFHSFLIWLVEPTNNCNKNIVLTIGERREEKMNGM